MAVGDFFGVLGVVEVFVGVPVDFFGIGFLEVTVEVVGAFCELSLFFDFSLENNINSQHERNNVKISCNCMNSIKRIEINIHVHTVKSRVKHYVCSGFLYITHYTM